MRGSARRFPWSASIDAAKRVPRSRAIFVMKSFLSWGRNRPVAVEGFGFRPDSAFPARRFGKVFSYPYAFPDGFFREVVDFVVFSSCPVCIFLSISPVRRSTHLTIGPFVTVFMFFSLKVLKKIREIIERTPSGL
jgi:hypothetical protein